MFIVLVALPVLFLIVSQLVCAHRPVYEPRIHVGFSKVVRRCAAVLRNLFSAFLQVSR